MADVQERLKKLGASARIGGKGTPRRKMKRAPARSGSDDKKLQQTLKKLNVQPIQAIEEVNMFKSDGNVIHFAAPKGTWTHIPHPPPRTAQLHLHPYPPSRRLEQLYFIREGARERTIKKGSRKAHDEKHV